MTGARQTPVRHGHDEGRRTAAVADRTSDPPPRVPDEKIGAQDLGPRAKRAEVGDRLFGLKPVAVLGLVGFVVLRVAYDRFYAPFGLSPDDFGLGYVELLTQSAIGVVVVLVLIGLFVWPLVLLMVEAVAAVADLATEIPELQQWTERLLWRSAEHPWIARLLVGVSTLGMALLGALTGHLVVEVFVVAVAYWAWFIVRGTNRIWRSLRSIETVRHARSVRLARWAVVVAMLLIFFPASQVLIDGARLDAQAVMNGRRADNTFFGARLTSWGADAATISWTTDKIDPALAALADSCVMYLGQRGGTSFVYSPYGPDQGTFRLSSSIVAVQVLPGGRCSPGVPKPTR